MFAQTLDWGRMPGLPSGACPLSDDCLPSGAWTATRCLPAIGCLDCYQRPACYQMPDDACLLSAAWTAISCLDCHRMPACWTTSSSTTLGPYALWTSENNIVQKVCNYQNGKIGVCLVSFFQRLVDFMVGATCELRDPRQPNTRMKYRSSFNPSPFPLTAFV